MTEKRFTIHGDVVSDTDMKIPITLWSDKKQQKKFCDELNALHEENQAYKKKIDIMADAFAQSNDLIEIEQVFYTKVYEPSEYYDEETLSEITNALLGDDVE